MRESFMLSDSKDMHFLTLTKLFYLQSNKDQVLKHY
jgi:hypothetical protein